MIHGEIWVIRDCIFGLAAVYTCWGIEVGLNSSVDTCGLVFILHQMELSTVNLNFTDKHYIQIILSLNS